MNNRPLDETTINFWVRTVVKRVIQLPGGLVIARPTIEGESLHSSPEFGDQRNVIDRLVRRLGKGKQ